MDYKIKYNNALEGIRELYNSDCDMIRVNRLRRQLKRIFPELQESEDEKIKREIVAYINELADLKNEKIPTKWLSWLEKQGQKKVTWNKEDEENMNNILYVFNQLKGTSFYKEDDTAEKIINWLKSLKDKLYSNNEYDKDMLGAIEYCKKNNRPLEKEHLAWLEKQGKIVDCQQNHQDVKHPNGAKWADEHPKPITLEAIEDVAKEVVSKDWQERQDRLWRMIERNLRAQFIKKSCEWLKDYAYMFVSETTGDLYEDDLINEFRKDMKGD